MSETNKVMSSIQFPNTQQPYQVNDARIPSDPGAYQQMVTDGNGNWGVADRLAWKEGEKVEITWDGNTNGLESTFMGDGYWYYKVSSLVLTDDAIRKGSVSIQQAEGTVETAVDSMNNIFEPEVVLVGEAVPGIPTIIFTREENITLGNYTFVSSGVWFLNTSDSYTSGFTCVEETTHPIPAEYLPKPQPIVFTPAEDNADTTAICNVPLSDIFSMSEENFYNTDFQLVVPFVEGKYARAKHISAIIAKIGDVVGFYVMFTAFDTSSTAINKYTLMASSQSDTIQVQYTAGAN